MTARYFRALLAHARVLFAARNATHTNRAVGGWRRMPGRLIVHAGAHKTGTTTTQLFLHYYHVWIRDTFDIHIVPNGKWVNH